MFEDLNQTVAQAAQGIEAATIAQAGQKAYAAMLTGFLAILGASGAGGDLAKALRLINSDNQIMAQLAIVWLWKNGCGHFKMADVYWTPARVVLFKVVE